MFRKKQTKLQDLLAFLILFLFIAIILTGIISYKLFSNIMVIQIAKSRVDLLGRLSVNMSTMEYYGAQLFYALMLNSWLAF